MVAFPDEISALRAEITALRAEVAALRADNERLRSDNDRLLAENEKLRSEIDKLRAEAEKLRRDGKRQAAPFSKGPPKADPEKPGRKPGNLYGRHAHRRPPEEFDEDIEVSLPSVCPHCSGRRIEEVEIDEQYQVEIPRRPIRRRFRIHVGRCRDCGRKVRGRHPLQTSDAVGAAASQLGPEAQALAVTLNKEAGLSHGKVCRVMETAFGIELSRGASARIVLRAAERTESNYGEILAFVRRSGVCCSDETGWKVGGELRWLWVFSSGDAAAYVIRDSRGRDVLLEVLGSEYDGLVVHDGWRPYEALGPARHQTCLRHLLRRCGLLEESVERGAVRFPRGVKALLLDALSLRDRRDGGEISGHGLAVARGRLKARLDRLLLRPKTNPDNERLREHLRRNRGWIFTFLYEAGVEATNWMAEQDIRPAAVNRKVWGGNRTEAGMRAQEVLMSVIRTCRKLGREAMDFIALALRSPPGLGPRLLPDRPLLPATHYVS